MPVTGSFSIPSPLPSGAFIRRGVPMPNTAVVVHVLGIPCEGYDRLLPVASLSACLPSETPTHYRTMPNVYGGHGFSLRIQVAAMELPPAMIEELGKEDSIPELIPLDLHDALFNIEDATIELWADKPLARYRISLEALADLVVRIPSNWRDVWERTLASGRLSAKLRGLDPG